jgi:hypothetical protein
MYDFFGILEIDTTPRVYKSIITSVQSRNTMLGTKKIMIMRKNTSYVVFLAAILLLFNSCRKEEETTKGAADYSSEVVLSWIDLTLKMTEETPGFTPPVAARVYGYSGLALYESVRNGMDGYQSMEGQVTALSVGSLPTVEDRAEYHWGAVANATLAAFLKDCFKTTAAANVTAMADLEQRYVDEFKKETSEEVIDRSVAYGRLMADAMLVYANSDGQATCYNSNFPSSYTVPVGVGLWESTDAAYPIPLQPYWGSVRPFMEKNVGDLLPVAPPAYSTNTTSDFYKEAMEVYNAVKNITPEQKKIAEFWSDDPGLTATPPGHSYSIMMQVLTDENADLAKATEVYAKLGMGIHDAFVSCWNAKYHYNLVRPITYVHQYIDNTWAIPLPTPPFPEYTSGHSVQSGATAQILTDIFGENYAFTDRTHAHRTDIDGTPRAFSSFKACADEAAISRLYGGIHYRAAIDIGLEQGIDIGKNIATLNFK